MPFEDAKPKDSENPMFETSSVLVAEASGAVINYGAEINGEIDAVGGVHNKSEN